MSVIALSATARTRTADVLSYARMLFGLLTLAGMLTFASGVPGGLKWAAMTSVLGYMTGLLTTVATFGWFTGKKDTSALALVADLGYLALVAIGAFFMHNAGADLAAAGFLGIFSLGSLMMTSRTKRMYIAGLLTACAAVIIGALLVPMIAYPFVKGSPLATILVVALPTFYACTVIHRLIDGVVRGGMNDNVQ